MDPLLMVLIIVGGCAALPIAIGFAKRIEAGPPQSTELEKKLAELERRLAETEDGLAEHSSSVDGRFLEMDDRLEFTERLMQQLRDRERLPRGRDE